MTSTEQSPDRPRCTRLDYGMPMEAACSDCGHRAASHTLDRHCDVCAIIAAVQAAAMASWPAS